MKRYSWAAVCCMLAAAAVAIVGCESTQTDTAALTVTPPSASITAKNGSAVFVAAAASTNATLTLPLIWSVSDPTLGSVVASGGLSAVYRRSGNAMGSNAVIVRDQTGAEGVATVNQGTAEPQ